MKFLSFISALKNMCGISDICAQICIPDGNSFKCDCESGYTLMKDGVSCKPTRIISKQNRYSIIISKICKTKLKLPYLGVDLIRVHINV